MARNDKDVRLLGKLTDRELWLELARLVGLRRTRPLTADDELFAGLLEIEAERRVHQPTRP